MSGGGGGRESKGAEAASGPIPAMSRKLVQTVKEIVNCPESEIYSMLKECNMDPNEAVHRLLSPRSKKLQNPGLEQKIVQAVELGVVLTAWDVIVLCNPVQVIMESLVANL